ncbi:metallophosphoesterase family protein [Nitrospira sp. BLG_2]|uniref:metallophosphoesterase family protein n=1 Tax=Nitrospira sp. BLG_2 TaxID=3397507 RepID=UPI003B9BE7B4
MKIVAVADQHGYFTEIPECDLLLIAGDICPRDNHTLGYQECWLDSAFKYWLKNQPVKKIILVAGNHDFIFESRLNTALNILKSIPHLTYLQDDYCYYEDYKIYGSPWQLYHGGWAFNLYEPELKEKWDKIPNDTHILVTHSPPKGYGDKAPRTINDDNETQWPEPEHIGSPSLTEKIKIIQPKLHVFGHIHTGFGQWQLNETILANVAQGKGRWPVVLTLPPVKP